MTPLSFKKKGGLNYFTLVIPTLEDMLRVAKILKDRGYITGGDIDYNKNQWDYYKEDTFIIFTKNGNDVIHNVYHVSSHSSTLKSYSGNRPDLHEFFDLYEEKEIDFDTLLNKLNELELKINDTDKI